MLMMPLPICDPVILALLRKATEKTLDIDLWCPA